MVKKQLDDREVKEYGKRPKYTRLLNVRVTDEQYEKLVEVASMTRHWTVSELLRFWVDYMIEREESGHYKFLSAHTEVTTGFNTTLLDPFLDEHSQLQE